MEENKHQTDAIVVLQQVCSAREQCDSQQLNMITKYVMENPLEEVLIKISKIHNQFTLRLFIATYLCIDIEQSAEWYLKAYEVADSVTKSEFIIKILNDSAKELFNQTLEELVVCDDAKQRMISIIQTQSCSIKDNELAIDQEAPATLSETPLIPSTMSETSEVPLAPSVAKSLTEKLDKMIPAPEEAQLSKSHQFTQTDNAQSKSLSIYAQDMYNMSYDVCKKEANKIIQRLINYIHGSVAKGWFGFYIRIESNFTCSENFVIQLIRNWAKNNNYSIIIRSETKMEYTWFNIPKNKHYLYIELNWKYVNSNK